MFIILVDFKVHNRNESYQFHKQEFCALNLEPQNRSIEIYLYGKYLRIGIIIVHNNRNAMMQH